ncbi:C-3',4' desaturase CrtD [Synechococcus sp. M16CYN]|uniref:C-3',4' desaturase CrtD n=1 Tax=Synechococcus sp. M16CYN TaxID=3103139 RepID=UPI0032478E29
MTDNRVIVIGGGVAGLTAAALLAHDRVPVTLLEAHHQTGGCAGTFRRGSWIFDVGATQVAGLEPGGSHASVFRHLGLALPEAKLLDPGCTVDLGDGSQPVNLWHDPKRWAEERECQFPGSERFWQLCGFLHASNWSFARRYPIVTPRSWWELGTLITALRPATLASGLFTFFSVANLLQLCGCNEDRRLRRFLDLQLKLYSQEPANRTAALYGATVLHMAQAPLGLWHLQESMQVLSRQLVHAIETGGGEIRLRHRVTSIYPSSSGWVAVTTGADAQTVKWKASDVICSLPPQCLLDLIPIKYLPYRYQQRLKALPEPSGALVLYGVVHRTALPVECPGHLQRGTEQLGSLFVSVSREGDGRAPSGQATLIASVFTPTSDWYALEESTYQIRKAKILGLIKQELSSWLGLTESAWLHTELATPRGFAGWTGRPRGVVGGLGQHPSRFGPFGLASRTPLSRLWLCGDSLYPGEGTAGVTLSALNACKQLMKHRRARLSFKG